jgi:hypothetical protein
MRLRWFGAGRIMREYGKVSAVNASGDGPEIWLSDEHGDWSLWDLWFCVLCVKAVGGDWEALEDAVAAKSDRASNKEGLWVHARDLRARLDAAGLDSAALAAQRGKGSHLSRARTKILKQGLSPRCASAVRAEYVIRAGEARDPARRVTTTQDWRFLGCRGKPQTMMVDCADSLRLSRRDERVRRTTATPPQ